MADADVKTNVEHRPWVGLDDRGPKRIPGLIWAFLARDRETVEPLPVDQPIECKPDHHHWVGLHLDLVDSRAKAWFENLARLSEHACELLVMPDDHQQLHVFPGMPAGVFADHRLSFDDDSDEFGHLRFIATDRLMITARRHPLQALEATKLDLHKKEECCASVPERVERIVEHIAAGAERRAEIVTRELESIEDNVLTDSVSDERRRLVACEERWCACTVISPAFVPCSSG